MDMENPQKENTRLCITWRKPEGRESLPHDFMDHVSLRVMSEITTVIFKCTYLVCSSCVCKEQCGRPEWIKISEFDTDPVH